MRRPVARWPLEGLVTMEFSNNYRAQMNAVKVQAPEFTGMSPTQKVTLEMGTLPRHEYYEDDVVFVKLKKQTAANEAGVAKWAAALGWDDVAPALVDPALVFTGTPPQEAVCTRWLKAPKPLAGHIDRAAKNWLTSNEWRKNRIFELLIWKEDDHQWNTITSGGLWWSIDHDEVTLGHDVGDAQRYSRVGNEWTDNAVASEYGQALLKEAATRQLPELLAKRVHALIQDD
jgi:hypothetical protein